MSNNSKQLTFNDLLNHYTVEIPIIQRDYAQGRDGKEELRKSFLSSLYLATTKNEKLELDFVYGDLRDGILKPLDGQQRLTTLFLLYWYAFTKNPSSSNIEKTFFKFTYETRTSSREFCKELVDKGIVYDESKSISEVIVDSSWFFRSWKKDPTIQSMLTMLDAIHEKFKNEDGNLWNKLNNITFHFIELQDFGLSDDLYIKMNARGKPLTDFENFKAKFEQYINKIIYKNDDQGNIIFENGEEILEKDNWEKNIAQFETFAFKLDTIWTDLFWNYRTNKEQIFDEQFLNFFKTFALLNYTLKANRKDENFRANVDLLRGNDNISFNMFLELDCINVEYFATVKAVLNQIACKNGLVTYLDTINYIDENNIFKGIIKLSETKENQNLILNELSYPDLVIAFGYYKYLAIEKIVVLENLNNWMRVVRNLVEGTRPYLFNNANEFANALRSIDNLLEHRNSILEYLETSENDSLSGFTKEQVVEEKLKAQLILKNTDWKGAILKIESHPYFNGQIGFLLHWCKDLNGIHDLEKFEAYTEKCKIIFSYSGLIEFNNFLFERALLTFGDYLLSKGQNYSFLINYDRDISWKRLLRDNTDKREFLKNLIDNINPNTIEQDLINLINKFSDNNDWRYYFIKDPDIILQCGNQKLIRWFSENNILLLSSTTTSGYHKEYYSYSLFLEIKKDNEDLEIIYQPQKSVEYWKFFRVKNLCIAFNQEKKQYVSIDEMEKVVLQYFDNRKMIEELIYN
ncbi:DUF262 domain-containing protein [Chryseobacterium balustinum]|uniref:Uncharacterized conserved protein, contains ParB-like and HNH nuclease domains n=1 Tax=Chryseobacterium balustinum TaxID=246 RepID=A0ABY1LEA7_9FLAO|nr:DUF262 domain-containing protein [Chryseobacterium balustinum]AZB32094.1 DUF262 domain-containing protein [Chryseobacterium balustinum]SKB94350.1 Uncharacterized conserved protein, contains ParB-like and HNH nuclease domains [Chryseobacterium balustinum]